MATAHCKDKKLRFGAALGMKRSKGIMVFAYSPIPQGNVGPAVTPVKFKVLKWPRKRGHPKSATTRAQVALWDLALLLEGDWDPWFFTLAYELTRCNAFYARDLLLMAIYGNATGWPGYGPQPGGS